MNILPSAKAEGKGKALRTGRWHKHRRPARVLLPLHVGATGAMEVDKDGKTVRFNKAGIRGA